MKTRFIKILFFQIFVIGLVILQCVKPPLKKFYMLNYKPEPLKNRRFNAPYPFTVRVKEFDIEKAYSESQIVYRKSPYELEYYFYRVWAVKPTRMISDIIHKHLDKVGLVSQVIRRYDEGNRPDYELSGVIEALEEYDSEEVWFAHLAMRFELIRTKDGRQIYSRSFDRRKKVFTQSPEYIVQEMSNILDFLMTQVTHDLDAVFAKEYGLQNTVSDTTVVNE